MELKVYDENSDYICTLDNDYNSLENYKVKDNYWIIQNQKGQEYSILGLFVDNQLKIKQVRIILSIKFVVWRY